MMVRRHLAVLALASAALAPAAVARAQDAATPPPAEQAAPQGETAPLPEVEVIQKKEEEAPKAAAPKPVAKPKPVAAKPKPKPAAQPAPEPEPVAQAPEPAPVVEDAAPQLPNSVYGAAGSAGAAQRATQSATTPVNPGQITPTNLEGFSAAATNLTGDKLTEKQPTTVNEALKAVPGVNIINDDGNAHHGGVAVRGSPARRSRKMLVMEDGHANNLALWLDPSVHFWGPIDRFESIEVIRGTVITHGPNNNFGVINARNLSPFGPSETEIGAAIGFTENDTGSFTDEDGETRRGSSDTDISSRWHVHTRQTAANVGIVLSYTGANVQGTWDTERLRFNDYYAALGWKGVDQDLVISSSYTRQRDSYDEQNFLGEFEVDADSEEEAERVATQFFGAAEANFERVKHCKTCYAPASGVNNYNGEIWRGQIVHNAYFEDDITLTTRFYLGEHRRDRYQLISTESNPFDGSGAAPVFGETEFEDGIENSAVLFGEDTMFGRLRTFRHIGGEVRGEWANRNILGFSQDLQAGIRYEFQDMTNRNFLGRDGERLKDGDEIGTTIFDRELDANAVSAFLQSNVKVATDFNVVPGVRFEWYEAGRRNRVIAREESEAGGGEEDDCEEAGLGGECLEIDGIVRNPDPTTESFDNFHALPGVAFAYTGLYRSTVFGGYHRGMSTGVLRNEDFPVDDEIGDNFNLGLRSSAIKGLDFEVVGFYQLLHDYQFGASFNAAIDRSFGRAEEVEIGGVELYGRLNSQPFTGGSLNFYGEGNYTYSRGIFKDAAAVDDGVVVGDFNGNRIPEVPLHVAALTLGVEQNTGWRWDASVTWTYRGAFFTDEGNTAFGQGGELECEEEDGEFECEIEEAGEDGEVPGVWLLSARFNLDIGTTGASVFLAGDNLLDEFYISDREDGMKPGLGRTLWTGFKYKF